MKYFFLISILLLSLIGCQESSPNTPQKNQLNKTSEQHQPEEHPRGSIKRSIAEELFPTTINWNKLEIELSEKERLNLIHAAKVSMQTTLDQTILEDSSLNHSYHILHLNEDALPDVIYHGWSGGEPLITIATLNQGDHFNQWFSVMQTPLNLEFENNRLHKITINNPGCCANPVITVTEYLVSDTLTPIKRFAYLDFIDLEGTDMTPVKFTVTQEHYNLRCTPALDDTSEYYFGVMDFGNIIGELHRGNRGIAYKSATDSTGRVWWLIATDPMETANDPYGSDDSEIPVQYIGWISSRYVETD